MNKPHRMLEVGRYDEKLEPGKENQDSSGERGFSFKQDGQMWPH